MPVATEPNGLADTTPESTPAAAPKDIISLKNLTINHSNGQLLSDINLTIKEGEFVYLIGKSGTGKTSLLRTLYGDRHVESGEATVCGFDLSHLKRRQIPKLRRNLGIVFQNFRLLHDRNVYDNLEFVLRATGWKKKSDINKQIIQTLDAVGLSEKHNSFTFELSEGEQQRVGIARALINNPKLILADEPTGNLDPITSSEIMSLLQKINQESAVTMLISTHDFMMIDKYPARVIACENKTLVSPM